MDDKMLFENLVVYQKSLQFVSSCYKTISTFPTEEKFGLSDQLKRAAISIPANIAEGNGRRTDNDTHNFYYIARGSAFECIALLEIASLNYFIDKETVTTLRQDCISIVMMLSKLIKVNKAI
jgi:four helix bundle protein